MKFILLVTLAILPLTFAIPTATQTTATLGQTNVAATKTFAPMPVVVAENGIMKPEPKTESTDSSLSFNSRPGNLEVFPPVVNDIDPQTSFEAYVATPSSRSFMNRSAKRRLIDEMTVEAENKLQKEPDTNKPHHYEESPQVLNPSMGARVSVVHPGQGSHQFGGPPHPNFGHGPVVHPGKQPHKANSTATPNANNHRFAIPTFRDGLLMPIGMGHGPVIHPGFKTATLGPKPTISYSNRTSEALRAPTVIATVRNETKNIHMPHYGTNHGRPIGPRDLDKSKSSFDQAIEQDEEADILPSTGGLDSAKYDEASQAWAEAGNQALPVKQKIYEMDPITTDFCDYRRFINVLEHQMHRLNVTSHDADTLAAALAILEVLEEAKFNTTGPRVLAHV